MHFCFGRFVKKVAKMALLVVMHAAAVKITIHHQVSQEPPGLQCATYVSILRLNTDCLQSLTSKSRLRERQLMSMRVLGAM